MTTLTVGAGQQYRSIAAAVAASGSGDVVNVSAGTYLNDFVSIDHSLTIQAVGGPVNILATYQPPNGKAIITEGRPGISVTLAGLTVAGAAVPDNNGAAVRYEGGTLMLDGVTFTNNQDGILGNSDPNGSITIRNSIISANGAGDGRSHGIYIGAINSFTLTNSTVTNTSIGHNVKSRAANNTITNNLITDLNGTASYLIDLPNGGNALISGNTIEKGPNADNPTAISYGAEGNNYGSSSFVISNNLVVNDFTARPTYAVQNTTGNTAQITGNTFYNWNVLNASGPANLVGNTVATTRPALRNPGAPTGDTQAAAAAVTAIADANAAAIRNATPPGPVTVGTGPGTILLNVSEDAWQGHAQYEVTVDGQPVGGVLTATSAHASGQTQPVTLRGSFGNGQHTVVVTFLNDAFGGMPGTDRNLYVDSIVAGGRTVAGTSLMSSGPASFRINTNGSTAGAGQEAATITPPAPGPVVTTPPAVTTTPPAATTIGSGSSKIVLNVSEDAWRGDAQFTVKVDGQQVGGVLTATALHGSGQSQRVDVLGNFAAGSHRVDVTFLNDAWGGTPDTDRNLYVDSVIGTATLPGAALLSSGTSTFTVTTAAPAPAMPAPAPAPAITTVGSGPDRYVLQVSEDAWQGDAQFTVAVDGRQVGGTLTATANHGQQASQRFDVLGSFGPGKHRVDVSFTNDTYGGSPSTDRNLYVDSVSGATIAEGAALLGNGTASFSLAPVAGPTFATNPAPVTVGTGPKSILLQISEDAWRGDAQFTVAVDGQQVGGVLTTTALHGAGQTQQFDIRGTFSVGQHFVGVSFINDVWGGTPDTDRNLYVDKVGAASVDVALNSNGTQFFATTVLPPGRF